MSPVSELSVVPFPEAESAHVHSAEEIPNFNLIGRIASGRFGEVWLARENLTDVIRAIKLLDKKSGRLARLDVDGVRRFQQCSHDHPHLVRILTVGQTGTCFYYVMEAADGEPIGSGRVSPATLRTWLRRAGPIEPVGALRLVEKLANAIGFLHEKGIRHNDIKPENILFVGGEPKIADVGLVSTEVLGEGWGTPGYMTPEGRADDLYAIGMILYEALTGRNAESFPRLPVSLAERPPRGLRLALAIVNRACAASAAQRFTTITEFGAAVRKAIASLSRRRQRVRRLWAAAGVAIILSLAGAGWLQSSKQRILVRDSQGQVYTRFELRSSAMPGPHVQRGEVIRVSARFSLAASPGHHIVVGATFDSRASCLALLYQGVPGPAGVTLDGGCELTVPDGTGAYEVRLYVAHVVDLEQLKESLANHNPPYVALGSVVVPFK